MRCYSQDFMHHPALPHFQERITDFWFPVGVVWTQLKFWLKMAGKTCFLLCQSQLITIAQFSLTPQQSSSLVVFRAAHLLLKPICLTPEIMGGLKDLLWLLPGKGKSNDVIHKDYSSKLSTKNGMLF
jgi:hypothetical protein